MKFTKETWRRARRTFFQALIPSLLVGLEEIDFLGDPHYIKGALIALLIPSVAGAIAAAMNVEIEGMEI